MTDGNPRSAKLPGGDLISAVLNRRLMALADRGRASGMVGARWADLAADATVAWPGSERPIPGEDHRALLLERVVRLDASPEIARKASKRSLQNPDLLFVGTVEGELSLQAADAKFSVETARAKQVSGGVIEGLLTLGDVVTELLPAGERRYRVVDGVFLCPDYLLTHLMFHRKYGVVRTTVRRDQVVLIPVRPATFFASLDGASLMSILAVIDGLPASAEDELTVGLYYFRLARAAIGCGNDARAPLLGPREHVGLNEEAVLAEAVSRSRSARSAYELILEWNADVDLVRRQREAVDRVAGVPMRGQEIRTLVEAFGDETGRAVPSVNQVRRRLSGWYRRELVDRLGPMEPPIDDLNRALEQLASVALQVSATADEAARRTIFEMSAELELAADPAPVASVGC